MIMLCYHDLADEEVNRWTIAPSKFRSHMEILREQGQRIVKLPDIDLESCEHSKSIVISFDDGRSGCSRYALNILEEFQYPACFYVCPGFIEGNSVSDRERYSSFMTWDDVRSMSDAGHVIGSHALTHQSFRNLGSEERMQELLSSREIIENQVNRPCAHFAAPYGYSDTALTEAAKAAGYQTLATTIFGVNRRCSSPFQLKRWEIHSSLTADQFIQKLEELLTLSGVYRVLILVGERLALSDSEVEVLAQYDMIVTAQQEILKILNQFNIRSCQLGMLSFESRDLSSGYLKVVDWIKTNEPLAADLEVTIQVA